MTMSDSCKHLFYHTPSWHVKSDQYHKITNGDKKSWKLLCEYDIITTLLYSQRENFIYTLSADSVHIGIVMQWVRKRQNKWMEQKKLSIILQTLNCYKNFQIFMVLLYGRITYQNTYDLVFLMKINFIRGILRRLNTSQKETFEHTSFSFSSLILS